FYRYEKNGEQNKVGIPADKFLKAFKVYPGLKPIKQVDESYRIKKDDGVCRKGNKERCQGGYARKDRPTHSENGGKIQP
ncbi:MAG: hypothetical protein OEV28_14210, partial [Nitrospirota bacterium]|nr:hypothetical protein [Nitrospirota bacterium]